MNEQIYNDIVNNILPKINQGFTITKDYFFDLFGRYVKLLVFTDIFKLICCLVILVITINYLRISFRKMRDDTFEEWSIPIVIIGSSIIIIFISSTIVKVEDIAKDIYVPEVRVMEEVNQQMLRYNLKNSR